MAYVKTTGTNAASADFAVPELARRLQNAPLVLRSAMADVGRALEAEARVTMDRQQTAYGVPWPLTKEGELALIHASKWLTSRPKGTGVRVVVRGYMGLHDLGRARGRVRRRMLPTVEGGLPPAWAAAIDRVLAYHLTAALKL